MKIEYVNHSIGNRFDDTIELNINLKNYPKLHHQILSHELKHSKKTFSLYDLNHDLSETKVNSFDLLKFMIKHPKSLCQLLPLYHTKKRGWVYDLNLILIYVFIFSLIGISGWIFYNIV